MVWYVAEWRRYRCYNRSEFARMCGISRTCLIAIESGVSEKPHPNTLFLLAKNLQCEIEHLKYLPETIVSVQGEEP